MDAVALAIARSCKGFLEEDEGLRLYDLARDHAHLGPIVEIGSYCGKSSVYLGSGARAVGGVLVCVDHHRGSEAHQLGEEYHDPELFDHDAGMMDSLGALRGVIRRADLEDTAVLVVASSVRAAVVCDRPLERVYIDGGHSLEAAAGDYEAWSGKIAPGGVLAIHDLFPDPTEGGQAPITIYRRALESGRFDEQPTTRTLGVLRRR